METLSLLGKDVIKRFCRLHELSDEGSKRQLLQRILDQNYVNDEVESFVEDVELEIQAESRLQKDIANQEKDRADQAALHLRQLELQIELERARAENRSGSVNSENSSNNVQEISKVKISQYMSSYDSGSDIGLFLTNFERLGEQLNVPKTQWATQLIKLLPSDVAAVVARMSSNEAIEYVKVKENLLARFKLSADAFRKRFRRARKPEGQPHSEFGFYLEMNLNEWIEASDIDNDFDRLKELFALEQYYQAIPDNLRYWLLDRKPTCLKEACSLADQYESRREVHQRNDSDRYVKKNHGGSSYKKENSPFKRNSNETKSQEFADNRSNGSNEARVKAQKQLSKDLNKQRELICFNCKGKNHMARDCDRPKIVAVCMPDRYKRKAVEILDKYFIPIKVNGQEVRGLRDTGAGFDVCSQKLVGKENYTGEQACFRQAFDSVPCFLPLAKVKLEGNFGSIETIAAIAPNPVSDYIISNHTAELCSEVDKVLAPVLAITRQMSRNLSKKLAREIEAEEKKILMLLPKILKNQTRQVLLFLSQRSLIQTL